MEPGDLIRLAWEADRDGRSRLRDGLLTLAVTGSTPADAWAERCRAKLVAGHPGHFLGSFASVAEALGDPRVVEATDRLRVKYPEVRVRSLLLRSRASRGPFLGRAESLDAMLEDLAGTPVTAEAENVRRDAPQGSRGPMQRARAGRSAVLSLAYPSMTEGSSSPARQRTIDQPPDDADIASFYLTVLLAIAALLASVQGTDEGRTRRP
jgi:hypothetical protein